MQLKILPPVYILNLSYTGLGIARSFAGTGIKVCGIGSKAFVFGNFSRYVKFYHSPDSLTEAEKLCAFLLDLGKREKERPVIFPTRDHDVLFLDKFRKELEGFFNIPLPEHETLDRLLNKWKLFQWGRECEIMSPETFLIQNEMELKRIENAIEYPVLVKPVYSADWRKDGVWEAVGGRKVILADTREALRAEYYKFKDLAPIVLVQRYIQGEDNDIFTFCSYCNKESKIVFWFNTHKVLQIPEKYGTGIIVKSTINRDILESSQRLLEKIHYTGISEIEYKRDSLIGKYYLIEVNTRMWDQHPLSKSWNIELPILVYENMTKGVLPVPASRFEEMTWIADDAYLEYWLVNRVWKGERNFLPHGRRRYAIWDIKDPLPLIVAIASLLIDLVRRVFRKLYSSSRRFGGRNIRSSSV